MSFQYESEKYNEHGESYRVSRESFIKQVLVLSTSLLGILVALHRTQSKSYCEKVTFSIVILSLCIGIIGLSIGLYSQVALHKKVQKYHKENMLKLIENPSYQVHPILLTISKAYQGLKDLDTFHF